MYSIITADICFKSFFHVTYSIIFSPTMSSPAKCPFVLYVVIGVVQRG